MTDFFELILTQNFLKIKEKFQSIYEWDTFKYMSQLPSVAFLKIGMLTTSFSLSLSSVSSFITLFFLREMLKLIGFESESESDVNLFF